MPTGDSGINKPFDRILKAFADEAPRLFLGLFGLAPAQAEADIQPLRPETAPPVVMPDYVALVTNRGGDGVGERLIIHAEFESRYYHEIPRDMARYGGSLAWQYHLPVESVLVLLRPEGVPAELPEVGHYDIGGTRTTHSYKVVRSWETDPMPVLVTSNPRLMPWALLMKSSDEQVRGIASLVAAQGDDEALARFLILGGLRYDRGTLNRMLGDRRMSGFIRAYLDGSNLVRELRDEARAEGQAGEARKVLRMSLRAKFPELESLSEIDRISSIEALESLIESVIRSNDEHSIHMAILAAAANLN